MLAFHLEALQNVTFMNTERKAGDVWLVTSQHTDTLIPPIGVVRATIAQLLYIKHLPARHRCDKSCRKLWLK